MERAIISVDGNAVCALLGADLQVGEAEYVDLDWVKKTYNCPENRNINAWVTRKAAGIAYWRLRERLPDRVFSYALGEGFI